MCTGKQECEKIYAIDIASGRIAVLTFKNEDNNVSVAVSNLKRVF